MEDHILIETIFFEGRKNTCFSKISLQVKKNSSFMTMFNAKCNLLIRMSLMLIQKVELHGKDVMSYV